jgi:hypothetical protein
MPEVGTGETAAATPQAKPRWRRRRVVAIAGGAVVLVAAAGTGAALASGSSAAPPVIPAARAYPSAVSVLAAMDSKGAVCSGAGQAGQFADCSADSNGDTVIGLFSNHADALAYADGMITLGLQLHTPTAEVVGPNWVVNTSPAFADEVVDAIGGQVITKANAQGSPEAEQWSVRYGGF